MVRSSYLLLLALLMGTLVQGQNITRPNIQGPSGLEVNSFTGNLFFQRTDLYLPGPGMPIDLSFSYNSYRDSLDWGYGAGWTFSYHYRYYPDTAGSPNLIVERPDGRRDLYTFNGSGYDAPTGIFDTWTETSPGEYVLESKFGVQMFFEDPSHQRITRMREPNGNELTFSYTGEELTQIDHSSGRSVTLNWQNGHLSQIVDANVTPQRQWLLIYEQDSLLRFAVNPQFKALEYVYNPNGLITNVIDRNGSPTYIVYDGGNRVKRIKSCDAELGITYATPQNKTYVVERGSAGEHLTRYTFDSLGNVLEKQGNCCGLNTSYGYDSDLNISNAEDGNGNQTGYGYDAEGNVLAMVDPLGGTRNFTYEPTYNNLTQLTDKNGHSTSFTYDAQGNLTQIDRPLGIMEQYAYNGNGQVSSYTDGNSETTSFSYNATGDLTQINYPIGSESFTYDGAGNLTGMTNPNGFSMTMEYDVLDRLTRIVDPLGHDQTFEYDDEDNLTKVVDENGYGTDYLYDGLDRLIGVDDSAGVTMYEYDGPGNLTRMTDANGHVSTFSYNGDNLLVEETDPEGNTTRYTYDSNRNLIQKVDPNGQTTTYTYDALNRLTGRSYPGNSESFAYDAEGNLVSASNNAVTMLFTYDALNRLTSKTLTNWGKSISYSYDDAGNRTAMLDPDGGTTQYQYDGNNRLTQLTDPAGNTTSFTYDAAGRMTQQTNGNGTYVQYYYDDADRVDSVVHRDAGGSVLLRFGYTYDARGNRLSMTDLSGTHQYSYDGSYRLDSVSYPGGDFEYFLYDATGNRTQLVKNGIGTQYTYDDADRLQAAGSATFTFDNNGNLTSRTDSTGLTTYSYDGQDRLTQVTLPSGATVSYTYDPFGNRLTRTDTSGATVRYFLDGANPLMEMNTGGQTLARYTSGLSMDSWLSMTRNGQTYFYHQDALGSVKALTDGSQSVAASYDYEAFGSLRSQTGAVENPFTYTGREWDAEVGLYYYRTRYYDAEVGRFTKKDGYLGTIEQPASLNRYVYVEGNPIKFSDPQGAVKMDPELSRLLDELSNIRKKILQGLNNIYRLVKAIYSLVDFTKELFWGSNASWLGTNYCGPASDEFQGNYLLPVKSPVDSYCRDHDWAYEQEGAAGALDAFFNFCNQNVVLADKILAERSLSDAANGIDYVRGSLVGGLFGIIYTYKDYLYHSTWGRLFCSNGNQGSGGDSGNGDSWNIPIIAAFDPNEIIGPAGYDSAQWVSINDTLNYTILYENDPDFATAAAQIVEIYLPLDSNVNPLSLRLKDFGFGDFTFTTPAGVGFYQTRLDDPELIDSLGVIVDVSAGLDFANNRAFWRFESLDPNTLLPPTDATLGFLPVNDSIRRLGEGYARFTIVPNPAAQTGDTIYEQAEIIFDDNPSIFTNTHFNTIDAVPPTLELAPVAGLVQDSFELDLTFFDDSTASGMPASGTESYDLFLSIDGQPIITLALGVTQDTLIRFEGQQNKEHCVYALARDNVVNVQPYTTTPLTCFLVRDTAFVNPLFPNGGEQFCVGDSILVTWEKKNVELVTLEYSLDNGSNYLPLADSLPAADTSYLWEVPLGFPVSDSMLVRAIATLEDSIIGQSDSIFSIGKTDAPLLTVADTAICAGDSLTLAATQSYASYLWSDGSISPTLISDTAGAFALQVAGANGCVSPFSDTVDLAINPLPAQPTIAASDSLAFCADDSVSLSGPAGFSYQWSTGDTSQSISVATAGSFTLTVIDSNACVSPVSAAVSTTVNPLPAQPTVQASGPLAFCADDSVTLSAPSGFAYLWSTGDSSADLTVSSTGDYLVSVIDGNGCVSPASDSVSVLVNPLPAQPVITASDSLTFCQGDSVILSGPAGFVYQWSNSDTTQNILVSNSETFTLAVIDGNGCVSPLSDSVEVVVNPLPAQPTVQASGPLEFCAGDSVTLSGPAGFTYAWSNGASGQSITVDSSDTYSLTVSDGNGCASPISAATQVTVNPLPVQPLITASDTTAFCAGGDVTLSAPSGFDYLWSNGETTANILVDSSGTFTVQVIDSNNCISPLSPSVAVTVNPLPAQPTIAASDSLVFCADDSVSLSGPAGFSYLWSTGATSQSITVDTAGSFTLTVIDSNACVSPVSVAVSTTVNPLPAQPTITPSGPLAFCADDSVTLSAPSGFAYQWNTGDSTADLTVSSTGDYLVSVIDGNGCVSPASDSVSVLVNPLPAQPSIVASGDTAFCQGDSVSLSGPAGFDYLWSTGDTSQTITVDSIGNFALTVTDSNGCVSPLSAAQGTFVNPLPAAPSIAPDGPLTFCADDSVGLSGPAGFSYQWSTGDTTQSIVVNTAGSYTLAVTDSNGCVSPDAAPVAVSVNPLPAQPLVTPTGSTQFCQGGSVGLSGPAGFAYLWSTNDTAQSIVVSTAGSYTLTVFDSLGCGSPASAPITVQVDTLPTQPVIDLPNAGVICAGDTTLLSGPAGYSYLWSSGQTTQSIAVDSAGNFSLIVFDSNGCESPAADTVSTTVNPLPATPLVSADGPTEFCADDSVTLSATPAFAYQWSNGDSTQDIVVAQSGAYVVAALDSFGCQSPASDSLLVQVNPLPPAPVIAPGDTTLCEGDSVVLTASGIGDFVWSNGATTPSLTVDSSSLWTVVVTDSLGCESPSSAQAEVQVRVIPSQPGILPLSNDSLYATVFADRYAWYLNGMLLPDSTRTIQAQQSGTYTVVAFNGPCASETSEPQNVIVTEVTKPFVGGTVRIFPNPSPGIFVIDGAILNTAEVRVRLFDNAGKELNAYQVSTPGGILHEEVDMRQQPEGTYFVVLEAEGERIVQRVIMVR